MSEKSVSESAEAGPSPDGLTDGGGGDPQARLKFVERASKTWTGQLVDLTGRNNLLYYRDRKVGNLPLADGRRRAPMATSYAAFRRLRRIKVITAGING